MRMSNLQKGVTESLVGIVLGLLLITIVEDFASNGVLPGYSVLLCALFNIVLNIATINSFRYVGLLYTIGWLVGSLMLREMLGPAEIVLNVGGPIVIIILRAWFWYKKSTVN